MLARTARVPAMRGALPDDAGDVVATFGGPFAARPGDVFADPFLDDPTGARLRLLFLRDAEPSVDRPDGAWLETSPDRGRRPADRRGGGRPGQRGDRGPGHPLERFADLVALTDFAAVYLALAGGARPADVAARRRPARPDPLTGHVGSARESTEGGTRAIVAALTANLGIAVTKFVAFLLTRSSSMLAESIHSARRLRQPAAAARSAASRASREATPEHPFGYGRQRYVYAFIVSIVLFSVGGLFALYEGVHKWQHPEPIEGRWWWVPLVVLLVAIGLEGYSFRTADQRVQPHPRARSRGSSSSGRRRRRSCPSSCSRTPRPCSAWSSRCSASS